MVLRRDISIKMGLRVILNRRNFVRGGAALLVGNGAAVNAAVGQTAPPAAILPKEPPRTLQVTAMLGRGMQLMSNHLRRDYTLEAATALRVKPNEKFVLRVTNATDELIGIQIRGLRLPSFPTVANIERGATVELPLQLADSGTFLLQATDVEQIARGLSTLLVVEETIPPQVHLELPFLVQDREHQLPPMLSLNGEAKASEKAADPIKVQPNTRVRLRMANATASRGFLMKFDGMVAFIVAIDSTPSEIFRPRQDAFPFGPGARYDVIFDVPAGTRPTISVDDGQFKQELMQFVPDGEPRPALPAVVALPPHPALPPEIELARAQRFECVFGAPNALRSFDLKRDTPTSLALINKSGAVLSVYLGGQVVRVLHPADDGWEPYWRDSLIMAIGQTVHVALKPLVAGKFFMDALKLNSFTAPERIALNVV